jgi:cholesterol oxidase
MTATATPSATGAVSLRFTEEMKGHVTLGEADPRQGQRQGRADGTRLMFHLTVEVEDVTAFVADPDHAATARGWVHSDVLGGRLPVEQGFFNLFVTDAPGSRRMLYRLHFADAAGNPLTLTGHKEIRNDRGPDVWSDTTTLYVKVLIGHVQPGGDATAQVSAAGVLHILPRDFARQLTTFRTSGGASARERLLGFLSFNRLFVGHLWRVYGRRPAARGTAS